MSKATIVVDEIVLNLESRNGLMQQWNKLGKDTQKMIKGVWVEIVTKHELHHKEEAK